MNSDTTIQSLLESAFNIVNNYLIPLVFALILAAFFWGLARYVYQADSDQARSQGKRIMLGGVIALFVAASIWGIVDFIQKNLGIGNGEDQPAPKAPDSNISDTSDTSDNSE